MSENNTHFSFPKEEEKVLALWDEIDAFHTSLELTKDKPEFSFFDGPPFATGTHIMVIFWLPPLRISFQDMLL